MYVDGVRVDNTQNGTDGFNLPTSSAELAIGSIPTVIDVEGSTANVYGLRLWSVELTPEQVAAEYAAGAP